jgi:hypothetical protein
MPRGMVLTAGFLLLTLIGVAALTGLLRPNESDPTGELAAFTGGNPARGKETIRQNGCLTCHTLPGIREANGLVGRRSSTSPTASTLPACCPTRPTTSWPGSGTRPGSIRWTRCRRAGSAKPRAVTSQPICIHLTEYRPIRTAPSQLRH